MQKKQTLFISLLVILFNINQSFSQTIREFHERLERIQLEYQSLLNDLNISISSDTPTKDFRDFLNSEDYIPPSNASNQVSDFISNEIASFKGYLNRLDVSDIIKHYLKGLYLHPIQLKVGLIGVKIDPPLWEQAETDPDNLFIISSSSFFNTAREAALGLTTITNTYRYESDFVKKMSKIKPRGNNFRNRLGLSSDSNVAEAYQKITQLQKTENQLYHTFIYQNITPNKTQKQLEIYLANINKYHRPELNKPYCKAREAFRYFFDIYTFTGELNTILLFKKNFVDKHDLNPLFENESFQKHFIKTQNIAEAKSDLLNTSSLKSDNEYKQLLNLKVNESDFIVIQKIIEHKQKENRLDYQKLADELSLYIPYFEKAKKEAEAANYLVTEYTNLYKHFIQFVQELQKNKKVYKLAKKNFPSTYQKEFFISNTKIAFAKSDRLNNTRNKVPVYDLSNGKKIDEKNSNHYYYYNEGLFTPNALSSVNIKGAVRDIFRHPKGDIILFIGTSDQEDYKYSKTTDIEHYITWPCIQSSKIRDRESSKTKYRGRQKGYHNTDIYYSFKEEGRWSTPKLLKGINTPYTERAPSFSAIDGQYIYFASDGYMGLGGFDIYKVKIGINYADKLIKIKAPPVNQHAINSYEDELFFRDNANGEQYLSKSSNHGTSQEQWAIYTTKAILSTGGNENSQENSSIETWTRRMGNIEFTCVRDVPYNDQSEVRVTMKILNEDGTIELDNAFARLFTLKERNQNVNIKRIENNINAQSRLTFNSQKGNKYLIIAGNESLEYFSTEAFDVCFGSSDNIMNAEFHTEQTRNTVEQKFDYPFFFKFDEDDPSFNNFDKIRGFYSSFIDKFANQQFKLKIIGYADTRGTKAYNLKLSLKRAKAIKDLLVHELEFPEDRIETKAGGEVIKFNADSISKYLTYYPVANTILDDTLASQRQSNRRVEAYWNAENNISKDNILRPHKDDTLKEINLQLKNIKCTLIQSNQHVKVSFFIDDSLLEEDESVSWIKFTQSQNEPSYKWDIKNGKNASIIIPNNQNFHYKITTKWRKHRQHKTSHDLINLCYYN